MKCRFIVIAILLITSLSSCLIDIPESIEWNTENYEPGVVAFSYNHLGFPDLIHYNSTWYASYREADDHGGFSTRSKIRILKSNDFRKWEEINVYQLQDYDVREGFFSYNPVTDDMYLHIHYCNFEGKFGNYGDIRENVYVRFDKSTNSFEEQKLFKKMRLPAEYNTDLLWMPVWHKGELYASGYRRGSVRFYKFPSLEKEAIIFSTYSENLSSETTLKFYNDKLYALMRRRNDAIFFDFSHQTDVLSEMQQSTTLQYNTERLDIGELGGPNMIINDSIVYIGGRNKDEEGIPRTTIFKYSLKTNEVKLYDRLISHGDNSYPALIYHNNLIYGLYYTQKNDFRGYQIRSFILHTDSI